MDTAAHVDRARAGLARLRDQLVEHQQRHPNPRTFVPADLAELFNETLADLEGVYGTSWVTSASMSRWTIVPASTRPGGYPAVASVYRDTLLGHVRSAIRRLSTDTPLRQDSPSPTPNHPVAPAPTGINPSLPGGQLS